MLDIAKTIALGVPMTLIVTAAALAIGIVVGIPIALALMAPNRLVAGVVRFITQLVRSVPILVWLFILFFGVNVGGFTFDKLTASIVVLGLVSACYLADVYRTAIASIPRGQYEASRTLSLSSATTFFRIILPQALRIAIPAGSTFALTLLKDSSIPSVIGVTEIAYRANLISRDIQSSLEPYFIAVILYIALSIPIALLARKMNSSLSKETWQWSL